MPVKHYPSYVDRATYDAIPKSVWADIAYSLALRLSGHESHEETRRIIAEEWDGLHKTGIIQQKPPKQIGRG